MRKIKRIIFFVIFLTFLFALLLLWQAKEKIIAYLASENLRQIFQAKVSIAQVELRPFSCLKLKEIKIRYPPKLDFINIKEISISYNPLSLLKAKIKKIEILGLNIKLSRIPSLKLSKKQIFKVEEISVRAEIKLGNSKIKDLKLNFSAIDSLQFQGKISAGSLELGKIKMENLYVNLGLRQDSLDCPVIKFGVFSGNVEGQALVKISKEKATVYTLELKGKGIDLARLTQELELEERFEISGNCSLLFYLKGEGLEIQELKGQLFAQEPGGRFSIKDERALSGVSGQAAVPRDLLLESLKNYHYDKGEANLFIDGEDLVLRMLMQGQAGTRDLSVVFHNALRLDFLKNK